MARAIVTGASSGIGEAVAKKLISIGYTVEGIGRNFKKNISFTKHICDLQNAKEIEKLSYKLLKSGEIDLLINCAGLGYFMPHEELSLTQISELLHVNLHAPILLTNLLLRSLKKTHGTIINITSIEAIKTSRNSALYSASKAGLRHFSQTLFEEVRKSGVNVVSINPDMTKTPFFNSQRFEPEDSELTHILPETVANSIEYILNLPNGTVINDLTIRPQKVGIKKKINNRGVI